MTNNEYALECGAENIPLSRIIAIRPDEYSGKVLIHVYLDFRGDGKIREDILENEIAMSDDLEEVKKAFQDAGINLELLTDNNGKDFWVTEKFVSGVKKQFEDDQKLLDACFNTSLKTFEL